MGPKRGATLRYFTDTVNSIDPFLIRVFGCILIMYNLIGLTVTDAMWPQKQLRRGWLMVFSEFCFACYDPAKNK